MECKTKYDKPLIFYDTPGTPIRKGKKEDAGLLKFILEYKTVNVIFVLVKFDVRLDEMLFSFSKHKNMLGGFPNIVYVITHIDTVPK
jgi:GTPase Era involved in 16S rRNA processing